MRRTVLTVIICALAAAVFWTGGYYIGSNSQDDLSAAIPREEMSAPPAPPVEENTAQAEEVTYVTRSDVSAADGAWTTVSEYETDLTGDGQPDKLTIYTSAEFADGEILWDDGQSWVAEVSDAQGGYYTLLSSYVSNGCVYAEVSEDMERDKTVTIIVTNGSGLSLKRYEYSSSGFVEHKVVEDAGVNMIYSSVPFYK